MLNEQTFNQSFAVDSYLLNTTGTLGDHEYDLSSQVENERHQQRIESRDRELEDPRPASPNDEDEDGDVVYEEEDEEDTPVRIRLQSGLFVNRANF